MATLTFFKYIFFLQLCLCNLWDSAVPKKIPHGFIFYSFFIERVFLSASYTAVTVLFSLSSHLLVISPIFSCTFHDGDPPTPPSREQRSSKKTLHWPSPPMLSVCSQLVFLSPLHSPINERSSLTSLSSFSPFSRLLRNVKTIWHLPGTSRVCVCGCVCTQRNRWINWETPFFK